MKHGRLSDEFRDRTKRFASSTLRLFVVLPKDRQEARTLGKQLLQSGTSVAAHIRRASRTHSDKEFASENFQRSHLARLRSRIFLPFPVPISLYRRKSVEILSCRTGSGSAASGRIAATQPLRIGTKSGLLELIELRVDGRFTPPQSDGKEMCVNDSSCRIIGKFLGRQIHAATKELSLELTD